MMKNLRVLLIMVLLLSAISCGEKQSADDLRKRDFSKLEKPKALIDRFSYFVGYNLGMKFKRDSLVDLNYDYFFAGIRNFLEEKQPLMTKAELDSTMAQMQSVLTERSQKGLINQREVVESNKREAFEFLEKNKKESGVVSLPSGLQYKILVKGSGSPPRDNDYVKIQAIGTFLNGKEFDNSYAKGKPIYLQMVKGVLPCWLEALKLMNKGAKWRLFSPPDLAFKEGNEMFPPYKVVIFDVELVDFQIEAYPDNLMNLPPKRVEPPGFKNK
jgi:FKBP-type peptidyl-prolyl cis-trans isomerase FklB